MRRVILPNGGRSLRLTYCSGNAHIWIRSKSRLSAIDQGLRRSKSAIRLHQSPERGSKCESIRHDHSERDERPRRPKHSARPRQEEIVANWGKERVTREVRKVRREDYIQRGDTIREKRLEGPKGRIQASHEGTFAKRQGSKAAGDERKAARRENFIKDFKSNSRSAKGSREIREDYGREQIIQTNSVPRRQKGGVGAQMQRGERRTTPDYTQGQRPSLLDRNKQSDPSSRSRSPELGVSMTGRERLSQPPRNSSSRHDSEDPQVNSKWSRGAHGSSAANETQGRFPWEKNDNEDRDIDQDRKYVTYSTATEASRPSYPDAIASTRMRADSTDLAEPVRNEKERRTFAQDDYMSQRKEGRSEVPLSIPYTTPASEFLYGTSVVSAALRAGRRKMYKLYIYAGEGREVASRDSSMSKLALNAKVEVQYVEGDWIRMLDKMSTGRPHNGYILEASPLPKMPITSLRPVDERQRKSQFAYTLDHQSHEESEINGSNDTMWLDDPTRRRHRFPFVLMLDEIVDPGNLGAILRSAYFLGVDAVAISNRNCAPFSPVTLKASAGASEYIRLFSIDKPALFMEESMKNGWTFYSAAAAADRRDKRPFLSVSDLSNPLARHPCVLILGSEGEGLRMSLRKKANYDIGIQVARYRQRKSVDSLNVSVAAGILCDAFLRETPEIGLELKQQARSPVESVSPDPDEVHEDRLF